MPRPHLPEAPARMSWACLLKRVFDIAIEYCPRCGGRLQIIAAIVDPPGDCQDPHAPGFARARSATLAGAPLAAVPGGLILTPRDRAQHLSRRARSS